MQTEEFLFEKKDRAKAFRLLSECYHLPSADLIKTLDSLEQCMSAVCTEGALHVSRMKEEFQKTDATESLQVDYAKLFVGPYQLLAPPYGSVYLEGERKVMGDSTIDARDTYRGAGLDISEDFQEAPDHIIAELEFMYFLIFKEIEAISNSDIEGTIDYLKKQEGFLECHLGAWVSEFADSVEQNAETEFYRNLARATKVFVKKDLDEKINVSIPGPHDSAEEISECLKPSQ